MQPATYTPTTVYKPAPLSIEAKKQSWQDGYAHALLGMGWFGAYARSEQHYADGYAAGEAWRERNGMA